MFRVSLLTPTLQLSTPQRMPTYFFLSLTDILTSSSEPVKLALQLKVAISQVLLEMPRRSALVDVQSLLVTTAEPYLILSRKPLTVRLRLSSPILQDTYLTVEFNSFDKDVSRQLPPINVSKSANLFDQSISCPASGAIPAFTASVKADVTASANAVVTLGASAEGTLVPPKLDAFGLYAGMCLCLLPVFRVHLHLLYF